MRVSSLLLQLLCRGCIVFFVASIVVSLARAGSLSLNFESPVPGSILDKNGQGTGLTSRMPGTGQALPAIDSNLDLDTAAGVLRITSTNSDLFGQTHMEVGEYLGTSIADLGFTGNQETIVEATFRDVQYSEHFDQFGLYIASSSTEAIRGGYLALINDVLFGAQTENGVDVDVPISTELAPLPGEDIHLTLRLFSSGGRGFVLNSYELTIQNLTDLDPARSGSIGRIVSPRIPTPLPGPGIQSDLHVGIFAANASNPNPKIATIDSFSVRVIVPEPASAALIGIGVCRCCGSRQRFRSVVLTRGSATGPRP